MTVSEQSLVAQWNEVLLDAIRSGSAQPTETTYQLFVTHAAIYDAWAAYDAEASTYFTGVERPVGEHTDSNKAEAISHAAYTALAEFFPEQQEKFAAFMAELGYDTDDHGTSPDSAAGLGNHAAAAAFAERAGDGSNYEGRYADLTGYAAVNSADPGAANAPGGAEFDPNYWQPLRIPTGTVTDENGIPIATDDPGSYTDQIALTPHWGSVVPFGLPSGDAVRPPPPPKFGDHTPYTDAKGVTTTNHEAYVAQILEVVEYSAGLTPEQKLIAEFWADGPRTESPPGHWNQFAQDLALRDGHGIDEDAQMFFALNGAILDAGIAAWEAKYEYDYVRPQSAIRHLLEGETIEAWAGPERGTEEIPAELWQPYQKLTFVTPPFPEFVSGHSAFSMAAAKTLQAFLGSDAFFDGESLGNYDLDNVAGIDRLGEFVGTELLFEEYDGPEIVLRWETLTEAAEEAGISRLYGGIHMQDGDLRGREVGAEVAEYAAARWNAMFANGGDDELRAVAGGGPVFAGSGDDVVTGSAGNDRIEAGAGRDSVFGRQGADTISGGIGHDALRGGVGADHIRGDNGWDTLRGGSGDDLLEGGGLGDRMHGGRGNDVLMGQDGYDTLFGGAGADDFVLVAGERGHDRIMDFERGADEVLLVGFADDGATRIGFRSHGDDLHLHVGGTRVAVLEDSLMSDLTIRFVAAEEVLV